MGENNDIFERNLFPFVIPPSHVCNAKEATKWVINSKCFESCGETKQQRDKKIQQNANKNNPGPSNPKTMIAIFK